MYTFYHRGRYGWAPRDVWNLNDYLNDVLGQTLVHMSETAVSYPMSVEPNEWTAKLKKWGEAFLALSEWEENGDVAEFEKGTPPEVRIEMDEQKWKAVEQALVELAPWWGNLWD